MNSSITNDTNIQITPARLATIERLTRETNLSVTIDLDRSGQRNISTPLPFLSHMLDAFACHGRFSLSVKASGDIEVDPHHLIEDCGIVLGQTIVRALGGFNGIQRAGSFTFAMDGSLVMVALDICGRRNLTWNVRFGNHPVGCIDPNLFREFYKGLADGLQGSIHVYEFYGDNDHHLIESAFKAFARALREAITPINEFGPLSTKGVLDES
jgi:imidazoleglycerol-phosphate dehydratase